MKKTNRVFYILTVIAVLCCAGFAFSASAAGEVYYDDIYKYTVTDGNADIVFIAGWDKNGRNVEIPSTLGGYPVKKVSANYVLDMSPVYPESVEYITFPYSLYHGSTMSKTMTRVTILNPDCKIEYSSAGPEYDCDAVIVGYKGSTAEKFAETYNKIFIDISKIKREGSIYGFSYLIEDGEATILWSNYGVADKNVIIPETFEGYPITRIGETAFAKEYIKSVEMPDSITEISDYAFGNCTALKSITFSKNLKRIGNTAFMFCEQLQQLNLPEALEEIGNKAFCESAVSDVIIPKNVNSIGVFPFGGCNTTITVNDENEFFSSDEYGVLFNKEKSQLLQYPSESPTSIYIVPDTVKRINGYAFSNVKNISEIIISDSVESLGDFVFYDSEMSKVVIPGSVKEIPAHAFENSDLEYIEIGEGVKKIGDYGLSYCGLKSVTLPSSITSIGKRAFASLTQIEHIAIPENVTSIGEYAFGGMDSLKSVSVYSKNLSLDKVCDNTDGNQQLTFYGYRLSSAQKYASEQNYSFVPFFDGVDYLLYEGNLIVSLSKDAAYLADGYLECPWSQYAGSTEVVLLDGVTDVGKGVFDNFSDVDIVIALGDNVHFYTDAFTNCNSLKTVITFGNSVFEENAFTNKNGTITYYTQVGKNVNIPSVRFSYNEAEKAVVFDGDVSVTSNDFFNLLAAVCYGYQDKEIEKLKFSRFTAEDFQFIYYKSRYETIRKNTIEEAEFTVEIDSENGEKQQISFNKLCEGIGNDEITKFHLVATDKDNSNFDNNDVNVGEENIFIRWAKALLALITRIFKLFEKIRK